MIVIGLMCISTYSILAPQVKASPGIAPDVVCVPFHGQLAAIPHDAWIGKDVILKGTAHDADGDGTMTAYKWDFGDGYSTDWISGVNPYILEAKHTYTGTMNDGTPYGPGKYFTAWLYVKDNELLEGKDSYFIAIREKTLDTEVNLAIDNGLWWLHKQQIRGDYPDGAEYGYWNEPNGYYVASTSACTEAFELQGHLPNGDQGEDPYVETVQRGLNYLFNQFHTYTVYQDLTYCPLGNPDANGNGIGLGCYGPGEILYESGMALMTISSTGTPNRIASTGSTNVVGRAYKDIVQDMIDWFAWGQSDPWSGTYEGGWRYQANYEQSDNSVSQWPVIGMEAAERNFGSLVTVPSFVRPELAKWLSYSQNSNGGFGYDSPWNWANTAKTGAGCAMLSWIGVPTTDAKFQSALGFLNADWYNTASSYTNLGDYYTMYGIMKGMRIPNPNVVSIGSHDWYAEYARYIVDEQNNYGGEYVFDHSWLASYLSAEHATAWALATLTLTVSTPSPVAEAGSDVDNYPPTIQIEFDASGSYHRDPAKSIVLYEWDFDSDGTWDYSGTNSKVEHAYPAYTNPDGSIDWDTTAEDYTATLRVTDNNNPALQDTDTCIVHITSPPWKPVADPGGPYEGFRGAQIRLDASKSFDPESKMYPPDHPWFEIIAKYEWDLDNDGQFDDSSDIRPLYSWEEKGTYSVGLRVTDSQPSGPGGTFGPLDVDSKYTVVSIEPFTVQFYNVRPFYDDFNIEKGATLTTYFNVTASDGSNEIPANGVSFELHTVKPVETLVSGTWLGIDGIAKASYVLSSYQEDTFEILVVTSPHNGLPVNPPSTNPVIYNLKNRISRLSFETVQSCSAAAIAEVEGQYTEGFTVDNDGSKALEVTYSQGTEVGGGFELDLVKAKFGVVSLEASLSGTTGISSGLDREFSQPGDSGQNQLIKNCITRWILSTLQNLPDPVGSLAGTARDLIDAENWLLGIDNYNSLIETDGYQRVTGTLEGSIGISSTKGSSRSIGRLAYAGVSGEIDRRIRIKAYSSGKIGFLGEFSFDSSIGAGLGLDLGFLKIDAGFSQIYKFSTKIGLELIYANGQISDAELAFEIEVPRTLYNALSFLGLAIPLKSLAIPAELSSVRLGIQFSMPPQRLIQSLKDYISTTPIGELELDKLCNIVYDSIADTMVGYSVRLESETGISFPIGLKIAGIGLETEFQFSQTTDSLLDRGLIFNLQKWPIEQHSTVAASLDTAQFILDSWIYSGNEAQPSGNVVQMDETQSHLYVQVFDEQGRHVGLNYQTSQVELGIPGSWYHDNDNGSIAVVLPAGLSRFTVKIDATYAEDSLEKYDLVVSALSMTRGDQLELSSTIQKGTIQVYEIYVPETGPPTLESNDNTPPTTVLEIGQPKYVSNKPYVTPDTPFTLVATDTDSQVKSTAYRITSSKGYNSGWINYAGPFNLKSLSDGIYTIAYNSTDNAGNVEPTKQICVTLFSWKYVFKDTCGRGTILKINTVYKFFQFIRPGKDYCIRKATYMQLYSCTITIKHCDTTLKLVTSTVNTKTDYCVVTAWDLKTRKQYLLVDKPGFE